MSEGGRPGWVIQVVPGAGESLGHYLSRFRRENCLSHKTLGEVLAVPTKMVSEWEVPSRRRIPDTAQLERLSQLVGLPCDRLREMFPREPLHLQTRLCPTCYAENPVHQAGWQQQGVEECDRHKIPLLSACSRGVGSEAATARKVAEKSLIYQWFQATQPVPNLAASIGRDGTCHKG